MRKALVCLIGALFLTAASGRPAEATPLSNTTVAAADVCSVFDCVTPVAALIDEYFFGVDPAGTLFSIVLEGTDPSTSGLFLYGYALSNFDTSPEALLGMGAPFPGIVGSFSFYCSDCGGTDAPTAAVHDFGEIGVFFENTILPGASSLLFGALSEFGPVTSAADVFGRATTVQADALTPSAVPEPASLVLMGAGLIGFARMARQRRRSS